ncbi:MAG: hypothetical protein OEQ15_04755 [Nitrosopumilus sp.]|nr:hypothetical protein [Nitrosopumilus sp.]MDH3795149.1 hypothetical protein [Nitrosopumilus sp.]MDH3855915.1 hypothetical protein [Nitrosopumilus sp.]
MSHNFKLDEIVNLEGKSEEMLQDHRIRFLGIIDSMGRQIAGGYKEGLVRLVDDEEHKMCIQHVLGFILTKDLDESLGAVDYLISKRKKVCMITIPLQKYVILMSVERNADVEKIVEKTVKLFENILID